MSVRCLPIAGFVDALLVGLRGEGDGRRSSKRRRSASPRRSAAPAMPARRQRRRRRASSGTRRHRARRYAPASLSAPPHAELSVTMSLDAQVERRCVDRAQRRPRGWRRRAATRAAARRCESAAITTAWQRRQSRGTPPSRRARLQEARRQQCLNRAPPGHAEGHGAGQQRVVGRDARAERAQQARAAAIARHRPDSSYRRSAGGTRTMSAPRGRLLGVHHKLAHLVRFAALAGGGWPAARRSTQISARTGRLARIAALAAAAAEAEVEAGAAPDCAAGGGGEDRAIEAAGAKAQTASETAASPNLAPAAGSSANASGERHARRALDERLAARAAAACPRVPEQRRQRRPPPSHGRRGGGAGGGRRWRG